MWKRKVKATAPGPQYYGLSFYEFSELGTYNAEKARGIAHTPEWSAEMAALQARYYTGMRMESERLK